MNTASSDAIAKDAKASMPSWPATAPAKRQRKAVRRTLQWLDQCGEHAGGGPLAPAQMLGVVVGGADLGCRQLSATERTGADGGRVFPGRFSADARGFQVPTLAALIEMVAALNRQTGRAVGIYPETKAPVFHDDEQLPLEAALTDLPALRATPEGAIRIRNGNPGEVTGGAEWGELVWVADARGPVCIGRYQGGTVQPERVFNL